MCIVHARVVRQCVDSCLTVVGPVQRWWTAERDALSAIAKALKKPDEVRTTPINGSVGHSYTGWLPVPPVSHHFNYGVQGDNAPPIDAAAAKVAALEPEPLIDRVVLFGARGMMGPAAVEALASSGIKYLLVTDVPANSGRIDVNQEKRRVAEAL